MYLCTHSCYPAQFFVLSDCLIRVLRRQMYNIKTLCFISWLFAASMRIMHNTGKNIIFLFFTKDQF